jgi:hypothetical protein
MSGGAPAAFVDPTPIWQQRFGGLRWTDMPGGDTVLKKIHFALWRRGLVKVITDDAAPAGRRLGGTLLPMCGTGTGKGKGRGKGAASASASGADLNGNLDADVDVDVDVDLDAGLGGEGDAEAGASGDAGARTRAVDSANPHGPGKALPKGKRGRPCRKKRFGKQPDLPVEPWTPQEPSADLSELIDLGERIRKAAEAAGMTLHEAAREGGMYAHALKPSHMLTAGPAQQARMAALLEKLVQRNHQEKEGA